MRRVELLITYMHEIAHLFVTFLALEYANDFRAGTPDECDGPTGPGSRYEAGEMLENIIFGGIYSLVNDSSGREVKFMVRLPAWESWHFAF